MEELNYQLGNLNFEERVSFDESDITHSLSNFDESDITHSLSKLQIKKDNYVEDYKLYADYDNEQFIFVSDPTDDCIGINAGYDWTEIAYVKMRYYYVNQILTCVDIYYTVIIQPLRNPTLFNNFANIYNLHEDYYLTSVGFIDVQEYTDIISNSYGRIHIYKDPIYGKNCQVPLSIIFEL